MRSNISGLLLAATLALPTLKGQEGGIVAKLDLVAWGDAIPGLSFSATPPAETITALPFQYSKPASYKGPSLLTIHQHSAPGAADLPSIEVAEAKEHESRPLAPGQPANDPNPGGPKTGLALQLEKLRIEQPTAVALARIPPGCTRATVLLTPDSDGTFSAMVVDDNPEKLPPGKLRIHNLSPHPIAMRINGSGTPRELKRNENMIVDAPDEQVIYELAYKLDEQWKFQETNILPVRRNEQTQMIILRNDNRFFLSSDGATGGFLQNVVLRRSPDH
jgi:hypothetical protein